jgi:hypothetical protein
MLKEDGESVGRIHLAQERDQCLVILNEEMNFQGNSLTT